MILTGVFASLIFDAISVNMMGIESLIMITFLSCFII